MNILKKRLKKSSRLQIAKSLRALASRRKDKSGSPLLVQAAKLTLQNDIQAARRIIDRFELVAENLSKDDTANLQYVKDILAETDKISLVASFTSSAALVCFKFALSALW